MTREEAIKILRGTHDKALFSVKNALETLVPELKESEDERIRKKLLETIGYFRSRGIDQQLCNEFLAYLEKQKEQKPAEIDFEDWDTLGYIRDIVREHVKKDEEFNVLNKWLTEHYVIQKPAEWSEEDKMNLNGCICSLHQYGYMTYADFLKHLPERFNLQPKQEWSEEDEKLLDFWLDVIDRNDWRMDENFCKASRGFINRLKSLRLSWKPSEEQMRAVFDASERNDKLGSVLRNLYDDLKKLM